MQKISKYYRLLGLSILGFLVRLLFIGLPGFKIDVEAWYAWGFRLLDDGFTKFYTPDVWTNYTPGFLYILFLLTKVEKIFSLNDPVFYQILKLPSILSEIALGILIFNEAKKSSKRLNLAILGSLFVFLNPGLIFDSTIWGQIDGVLALCMFLAIYYLDSGKIVYSSLFLGLAFLVKPQAIALFPLFLFFILKNFSFKNVARLIIPATILVFLLFLPFFPTSPIIKPATLILNMVGDYPYTSLFAYNFWGIFGFWKSDQTLLSFFSYQTVGTILFAIYTLFLGFLYFKKRISLYSLAALACMAFYFLPTRVHDRYLYPALPFLVMSAAKLKSRVLFFLTGALSLTFFLNLYYVYVYYNEFFYNMPKLLYYPPIYSILDAHGVAMSVISSILFVLITYIIIKSAYAKKTI